MQALLAEYLPYWLAVIVQASIVAGLMLSFVAISALFFIWLERKVSGRIQDRLGPTRVGGRFGWLQTVADGIKLLTKEDTIPTAADRPLFRLAPILAFVAAFTAFLALPFGKDLVGIDLSVAAFFMLAVMSSEVFGVILAGYASASKWSLFGGIREAAQVVSYEVPRALCVLVAVIVAGSLNLNTIGNQQAGFFWQWHLFHDPFTYIAFFIFFICATASCKRAPFDLAEAESELVAGFHTEYSGLRWSFFFMAEYGAMFAVSGLATILFLGGWHTGILPAEATTMFGPIIGSIINAFTFIVLKSYMLVLVMMWMRWSLPRLRIDQVMMTCLKYFLPISCGLLLGVCLWRLLVPMWLEQITRFVLAFGTLIGLLIMVIAAFRRPLTVPAGELAGVWAGMQTPGMRGRA